jgi:AAA+ superfamily predicted ATPase
MGAHSLLQASSPTSKFITVFKPPNAVSYTTHPAFTPARSVLSTKIKTPDATGVAYILFHVVDVLTYFCLAVDPANGGYYTLTKNVDGVVKKLGKVAAASPIRPNLFVQVSISLTAANLLTVFCGGSNIFNNLKIDMSGICEKNTTTCWFGLICKGGRSVIKDWSASYFGNNGAAAIECKMTCAVDPPPKSEEETSGDVDERLVDIEFAGMASEDRKFAPMLMNDVVETSDGASFSNIVGCDNAKRLLEEAVILPMIVPQLFTGIRRPWKGVLLYGPPGTGKTLLAKAVAGQNGSKFFNCSAATLVSKYRGESEKIVKCLFWLARHFSPSVVFLDEVDALVGTRGGEGEHEASRRFKTELFVQIDGVVAGRQDENHEPKQEQVMVLAATNNPWDLDEAMVRRLEKRIFIPLPDTATRTGMFLKHMGQMNCGEEAYQFVREAARLTEGYSGADIKGVCSEASMERMRKVLRDVDVNDLLRMKQEAGGGQLTGEGMCIDSEDFMAALSNTKNTVKSEARFKEWDRKYGSK